jgi:hypothetical protein
MLKFSKIKIKISKNRFVSRKMKNLLEFSVHPNQILLRQMNCLPDIQCAAAAPVPNIPPGYHYGYISTYSLILKTFKEPGFAIQPTVLRQKEKSKNRMTQVLSRKHPVLRWGSNNPNRRFFESDGFLRTGTGGSLKIQRTAQRWYVEGNFLWRAEKREE